MSTEPSFPFLEFDESDTPRLKFDFSVVTVFQAFKDKKERIHWGLADR